MTELDGLLMKIDRLTHRSRDLICRVGRLFPASTFAFPKFAVHGTSRLGCCLVITDHHAGARLVTLVLA